MSDSQRLLELIEEGVVKHGGDDLGGWTRLGEDELQLFDGRVTLRAVIKESDTSAGNLAVHAHVLTTLHEYEDEVLDACLFGMNEIRDKALSEAAGIWIAGVAGPIKSFLDNKPVCMTCQAGVTGGDAAQGYSQGDYGLPGLRAYVGPSFARFFDDGQVQAALDDTKPWFRFAAEAAAPRRVHLAKASLVSQGKQGWRRELEIDGHDVSHQDPNWPAGVRGPEFGYLTRYAVFEFPRNSQEIHRRVELERTICHFAEHYSSYDDIDQLMAAMESQGFHPDLVHETEAISTIAFGRSLFERLGVQYSSTIIRAHQNGRIETDVPLMSIPAYSRARALSVQLRETMKKEDYEALCCYNAESNVILQVMDSQGEEQDFSKMSMYPCVVPDRDVSQQTMDAALATLNTMIEQKRVARKKPWWKFW